MEDDAWEWEEIGIERVLKEEWEGTTAFANDGSSYVAYLTTKAEFGCTMHEEDVEYDVTNRSG